MCKVENIFDLVITCHRNTHDFTALGLTEVAALPVGLVLLFPHDHDGHG